MLQGTEKPVRVAIRIAQEHDNATLGDWYTAIGTRRHNNGEELSRETAAASLADVGLPAELIEAWDDESLDEAVAKSHHEGMDAVGDDIIVRAVIDGPAGQRLIIGSRQHHDRGGRNDAANLRNR